MVCWSVFFFERSMKIDDPVGAISVHGTCGAWGVLSLGLFADGTYGDGFNGVEGTVRGLFYGGASQFVAQVVGTATCLVFIFGISWVFFKALDAVIGMRVSPEEELEGLDVPEMGTHGYPEIQGPNTVVRHFSAGVGTSSAFSAASVSTMAPERGR
jgi:Amt family ammonium transporter